MDRLNQLRGDAAASRDSTLDSSSLPSEAYITANESSKYFSLSEVDSSFESSPPKDSGGDATANNPVSGVDSIIPSLSPIPKKNELDSFKIGEQIEAANILSGGVNIFDDNENSYDEDELIIDDAVQEGEDKGADLKIGETAEHSFEKTERLADSMEETDANPSKDTEVVLQIDGKNVDAIDIGNGLYLYRKEGEEELAAVQILDDDQQQPIIKFLKVRENAEGNLEVYEEIEIEVPKEVPAKEGKSVKNTSHIPVKDVNKVIEPDCNKVAESQTLTKDISTSEVESDLNKDDVQIESKTEVNLNGKMMKFSESRKSPLIGTFTPMTYHSTPNKEGIPLTKTMVDLQLHPNRHSENVKKTIEVHTDNCKQRLLETPTKNGKDANEFIKNSEIILSPIDKELANDTVGQSDANSEENIKSSDNMQVKNQKIDEKKSIDVNNAANIDVNNEIKSFDTEILKIKDDKTEKSEIKTTSQSLKPLADSDVEDKEVTVKESDIKEIDQQEKCTTSNSLKGETSINEVNTTDMNKIVKNHTDHLGPKIAEEKRMEHTNTEIIATKVDVIKDNSNLINNKELDVSEITTKTESGIIKSEAKVSGIIIVDKQNLDEVIISTNKEHKINNILETPVRLRLESKISEKNKRDIVSENVQNDVEMKDIISANPSEKSFIEKSESLSKSVEENSNKGTEQQANKSVESSLGSLKEAKVVTNVEIKDPVYQTVEILKSTTTEVDIKSNNPSESPVEESKNTIESIQSEDRSMEILEKSPQSNETHILLKQPEASKNKSPSSKQAISITAIDLKQPDDKFKINSSKDIENKNNTETLKADVDPKETGNEPKQKVDNLLQTVVKKFNVQLKEPGNTNLTKSNTDAINVAPKADGKTMAKGLVITDGNYSRNSLPVKKNAGEISILNKSESNKKIPEIQQCTKISLPNYEVKTPHSNQTIQKEVEQSKKELVKVSKSTIPKPINNIKAAVPFGKWTEANRQEFLNKIKEAKVPTSTSNTKQLKQPNDLNRRDVLQKIDSQRQSNIASAKGQELITVHKLKNETAAFASKSNVTQPEKSKDNKVVPLIIKTEETSKIQMQNKSGHSKKVEKDRPLPVLPVDMSNIALNTKKDPIQRKAINNQDLIDKTIEGIINRAVTAKLGQDDVKQNIESLEKPKNAPLYTPVSLDEIESKMNELHGIPFVERPPHELPQVFDPDNKSIGITDATIATKSNKIPSLLPFANKPSQKVEQKVTHSIARANEESDEEIIEHEPITGDIELNKNNLLSHVSAADKIQPEESIITKLNCNETIITENDFDKFARRNSINYENCLTVNFDGKEQHNVIQTVVEKESVPKKLSRNEIMLAESKAKSNKHIAMRHNNSSKIPTSAKTINDDESFNKNYQSKVQMAYQSVMTAKRQQECPITIIEDKPVKVVFMDANTEFNPQQLNVQGKELSPPKKSAVDWDHFTHSNSESLDSDTLDVSYDNKLQDDTKFKSKHQRKQVLTPVETPELELIEPRDLGLEVSPKKKRKIEDKHSEKNCKTLVPKKSYLLNRNVTTDDTPNPQDMTKTSLKESINQQDMFIKHSDPISAIDNLVKAAELLETQSDNKHALQASDQNSFTQQNTPIKRGRGRPRKYPLPEGSESKSPSPVKTPTPQKKPRLIDAKIPKHETESEDDEVNSDGEFVKENWTMGKINENIVCPICNKLFRSENVVFKHVKHCTGPSPSRSDSDKRSPRRTRPSQELDWKSEGSRGSDSMDIDEDFEVTKSMKKGMSKETRSSVDDKADVIVIEDTPVKQSLEKREKSKHEPNKTTSKINVQHKTNSLVCEFCGKTFRQLSYLVSHKLQHKNIESKKIEKEQAQKSLFTCETCKKEFRKLHHLVQHRIIHNPNPMSSRSSRKSSSEQSDTKTVKDASKNEDQSAGFRCEPCDKSFRKLHHLVEHRETHDEINKKCNTSTTSVVDNTKPNVLHYCDVCKKTFKKLQHLIEHKEHHLDTSSEKSDDKSVKSSLSTKDIIHECPLCYMVFPNEHSLNKHTINCQRKKKQSAAKQAKQIDENQAVEADDEAKVEANEEKVVVEEKNDSDICVVVEDEPQIVPENKETNLKHIEKPVWTEQKKVEIHEEIKPVETGLSQPNTQTTEKDKSIKKKDDGEHNTDKVSVKTRKHPVPMSAPVEIIKLPDTPTPKKKATKEKYGATVTKRQKTTNAPLPVIDDVKTAESSDDDEVRYMLNPDFKMDEDSEVKMFMKVRANKRNSLQIERPNSKDLVKRRISLQHPPKIPRLKVKPIQRKPINTNTVIKSSKAVPIQPDPAPSTDSDDSDVKYSFPVVKKDMTKDTEKKVKRQTTVDKRKSLSNIAKRKSLGKMISAKHKVNQSPAKLIRKRTAEVEHRCDCGQLFSSAALLSRHTSLAHTPPRIRRRRSPPPDNDSKLAKPPQKTEKPTPKSRKSIKTDAKSQDTKTPKPGVATRKSSVNSDVKTTADARKTPKSTSLIKTRRSAPHKGVPVPEKMRKLMEKSKK